MTIFERIEANAALLAAAGFAILALYFGIKAHTLSAELATEQKASQAIAADLSTAKGNEASLRDAIGKAHDALEQEKTAGDLAQAEAAKKIAVAQATNKALTSRIDALAHDVRPQGVTACQHADQLINGELSHGSLH